MRKPKAFLIALVLCAAIPLGAAAPASGAGQFPTKCGGDGIVNGSGWFKLKTFNTACANARKLADHYVFEAGGNDDGFKGWRCRETQIGDEVWRVTCKRDKHAMFPQKARFKYGA